MTDDAGRRTGEFRMTVEPEPGTPADPIGISPASADPLGTPPAPADPTAGTIPLKEAAQQLGISERTVRRRIRDGTIEGYKQQTEYGYEWRVSLGSLRADPPGMPPRQAADPIGTALIPSAGADPSAAGPSLMRALNMIETARQDHDEKIETLYEEIAELKGTTAHWQTRALIAEEQVRRQEEQIALLMAPKEPDEPADVTPTDAPAPVEPGPDWQALAQALEEHIRRLEELPAAPEQPRRSWWRRLLGE